eukprot:6546838-Pyramimonas_sp.AAC.1
MAQQSSPSPPPPCQGSAASGAPGGANLWRAAVLLQVEPQVLQESRSRAWELGLASGPVRVVCLDRAANISIARHSVGGR